MAMPDAFELLIEPRITDLGEFSVRRALPDQRRQRIGPFVFFDHMGPADFPPGSGVNVRAHPHIGLATITYLFAGEILHRDSLGCVQPIRPGEVNWMTAGKGIVHSEKVTEEILAAGQHLHGIQTWVGLPIESEEIEPRFEHYAAEEIPALQQDGIEIRVVVGSAYGVTSPVRTESDTLYVELKVDTGASIVLPDAEELGFYVIDGSVEVREQTVGAGIMAVVQRGATTTLTAATPAHVMLCGGATLAGERIVWWNFVSSSPDRLERAKRDWREGRFAAVPGETEFIPLPDR